MKKIDNYLVIKVKKLNSEGKSRSEIAKILNRSISSIYHICSRFKIKSPKNLGLRKHPLYSIASEIRQRCENDKNKQYKYYGFRGIKACELIKNKIDFIYWALDNGWKKGLHCDRIDNDGNYSCGQCNECIDNSWPTNIRFVTQKENNNNKRNNLMLIAFGEEKTISEWTDDQRCVCDMNCLRARIQRGWPHEKAITKKIQNNNTHMKYING